MAKITHPKDSKEITEGLAKKGYDQDKIERICHKSYRLTQMFQDVEILADPELIEALRIIVTALERAHEEVKKKRVN